MWTVSTVAEKTYCHIENPKNDLIGNVQSNRAVP